jgi:hypothetical protein
MTKVDPSDTKKYIQIKRRAGEARRKKLRLVSISN